MFVKPSVAAQKLSCQSIMVGNALFIIWPIYTTRNMWHQGNNLGSIHTEIKCHAQMQKIWRLFSCYSIAIISRVQHEFQHKLTWLQQKPWNCEISGRRGASYRIKSLDKSITRSPKQGTQQGSTKNYAN